MGDYWEPKDAIAREKKISVGMAPQRERTFHYVDETDQASAKPSKSETSQHIKWQKSQNDDRDRKEKAYCCTLM